MQWITPTQLIERTLVALKFKQKAFVAHPNVQQLLATIWYEGLPGWRRLNIVGQGGGAKGRDSAAVAAPCGCQSELQCCTKRRSHAQ